MVVKKQVQQTANNSLLSIVSHRYLPYWPLFALLAFGLLTLAFIYTKYLTPVYKVNATLVINDEQKGVQESETLRSLNIYAANKIVENEVEVLKSRTLMQDVVMRLNLYAPVFEKGRLKSSPAYLTSPIIVQAYNPAKVKPKEEVSFEYNEQAEQVRINNRYYPLNAWTTFPYGVLRFVKNPARKRFSVRPLFFSILNARSVVLAIRNNLEVGAGSKLSSVVNITFTDEVPERGEDIVNQLLQAYNRAAIENNNKLASNSLGFITERIRLVEGELDSIEKSIQQYKSTQGIVDLSQQGRLYLESVAENDRKAADINTQMAVLNQVERNVQSGVNKTGIVPTTLGINDPVLVDLLQKLNDLELQYTNLSTKKGENNPVVNSIENEIKKIRPNILNIVRNQRAQMQASLGNYNRTSGQVRSLLKTIPQKERQLLDISRQQAIKNDVYAFLLQRREEAELSSASTVADSRIVDRAEASVNPVRSKKMIILLGALVLAIALGIAYVFLIEGLAGSILFRSELTKSTFIPVIGEITFRRAPKEANLVKRDDPILSSQFHQLSAALGLYKGHVKKQKLLITSSLPNEGKTFVCNQLALSLAAAEQKVVVIDLNLHHPETSALYHLKGEPGIVDYIEGATPLHQLIRKSDIAYLDILPAGLVIKNTTALLMNEKFDELFLNLEKEYDYILIDAPPIELATDAFILSRYADSTLYIVRHAVSPKAQIQKLEGKENLKAMKEVVLVFNGIKARGFLTRYYGIGYGYGYENIFSKKAYTME
jgi:capsular exopolysaccharide synthesis family protein